MATRLWTASRREGSAQPCGTEGPSWSRADPPAGPARSTPILTTGCSVHRPRPGDASGQGYRDNSGILTHGPPGRRRRRFGLRDCPAQTVSSRESLSRQQTNRWDDGEVVPCRGSAGEVRRSVVPREGRRRWWGGDRRAGRRDVVRRRRTSAPLPTIIAVTLGLVTAPLPTPLVERKC